MTAILNINLTKHQKQEFLRIIIDVLVLIGAMIGSYFLPMYSFWCYLPAYLIAGYPTLKGAINGIKHKMPMDEHLLMSIATVGALYIGEYPEAVMVFVLFDLGSLLEDMAINHSRKSIKALLDIAPKKAYLYQGEEIIESDPEDIDVGSILIVRKGDMIPLDSVVIENSTTLDTSSITGESLPVSVNVDDLVYAGSINLANNILIKTIKVYDDSMVAKIIELVEDAGESKSNHEKFITKFARIYTPIVVVMAIILAVIPGLIFNDFKEYFFRACTFLVISCPCALVISVPLTFFSGIGACSKNGILVKGGNYLEMVAEIKHIVSDKTGTITTGNFIIEKFINHSTFSDQEILSIACSLEAYSSHPIAQSFLNTYQKQHQTIDNVQIIDGHGIVSDDYLIGNEELLKKYNIEYHKNNYSKTVILLADKQQLLAEFLIEDEIKPSAFNFIQELKKMHKKITVLSGDNFETVRKVADKLAIDEYYAKMLPLDKSTYIKKQDKTIYIGDGINDAPVLKNASIGISMGVAGSDLAIEASDVVIVDDNLNNVIKLLKIAKKTMKIVKENIIFILGVKVLLLVLGAFGYVNMWMAIFGDVGVSLIAIINGMRALK